MNRWQEGRIGFHHDQPMPLLLEHWPALELRPDSRVLVPLCGKSRDMLWLAGQGMQVLGVELSPLAVDAFLTENSLSADTRPSPAGPLHEITNPPEGGIEVIQGDIFDIDAETLAGCGAFYDRAALIALPRETRDRLVREVYARLPDGARGLLITLEYQDREMDGPPFAVDEHEVHRLFEPQWDIQRLERRDILESQPRFAEQGVTALHTGVYGLRRKTG